MSIGSKKNKRSKRKIPDHLLETEKPLFCTECNNDLDAFWLSSLADNPDDVRRIHENCKRIGRFNGEQCSKLYIISDPDIGIDSSNDSIFDSRD